MRHIIALSTFLLATQTLAAQRPQVANFIGPNDTLAVDRMPTRKATIRESASLVATMSQWDGTVRHTVVALQADSAGHIPMAVVGDTLYATRIGEPQAPLRVLARYRYLTRAEAASSCGSGPETPGWAYVLTSPVARPGDTDLIDGVTLLPWRLPAHPALATPRERHLLGDLIRPLLAGAANRAAREYAGHEGLGSASQIRRRLLGAKGLGLFADISQTPAYAIRGPHGARLLMTSTDFDDDLSDHGNSTELSLLMDETGRLVATDSRRLRVLGIADLDGDGMDEIITTDGVVRLTETGWTVPHQPLPPTC